MTPLHANFGGRPWADENLVLTAVFVLPGFVSLFGGRVGEAAFGVMGEAEEVLHALADDFQRSAVEGGRDPGGGPGADQRSQAQQQGAEPALLLVPFQEFQPGEAGLQHLGHQRQPFALPQWAGFVGHELQQLEPQ